MSFRYSPATRLAKKLFRTFFPVPKSPYTAGAIGDICSVHLVPPEDLKRFFKDSLNALRSIKGEAIGDYLEFGVFNGASMSSMYLTCKELGLDSTRFFGFDAFQGLPASSENEDDGVWKKGFYACSFEQMENCLKGKGIDPANIHWVKGWYEDTLNPDTIKNLGLGKLGIVFVDCDTYSSSKAVLDFIAPLITEPAIICLDDWKLNDLDIKGMGEYRSFNEFLETNPHLKAKEIKSYNRKSKSFLVTLVK